MASTAGVAGLGFGCWGWCLGGEGSVFSFAFIERGKWVFGV